MTNQEADISTRRVFAAMGNLSEEEFEDGGFKNQSLLAIEQSNKYDFLALIAETYFEDDEEDVNQSKVSFHQIKVNIESYSKKELGSLLSTLIDAYRLINCEREQMMENYAS